MQGRGVESSGRVEIRGAGLRNKFRFDDFPKSLEFLCSDFDKLISIIVAIIYYLMTQSTIITQQQYSP